MGTIYRPALWEPSYEQGFARGASEAANPNLWDELLFNWHGPLGVTGIGTDSIKDTAGRSHHGTPSGMDGSDWVMTEKGWALEFDENDDYVQIPDFDYGPFFSVGFWYKLTDNVGTFFQYMFSHGAWNTANSLNIYIAEQGEAESNNLRVAFRDSNDASAQFLNAGTGFVVGWHFVVFTVGINGATLYVDGLQLANDGALGGDSFDPNTDVFIGSRSVTPGDRYFGGQISNVFIYGRALTFSEAQHLHRDEHAIVRPRLAVPLSSGAAPAFGGLSQIIGGGMVV